MDGQRANKFDREVLIEVGEDVAVGGVLIKALSALKVPAAIAMGHATGEFITAGGQQTEENVRELNKLIGDPKLVAKLSSQAAYPAALAESMVAYGFAKVPISQRPGLRQILGITRETGSGGIEEGVNIYINNRGLGKEDDWNEIFTGAVIGSVIQGSRQRWCNNR